MDDLSIFAERIIELKEENHLSNLQFEKVSGCKNQSISTWLTRNVYPKLVNLLRMSDYFQCSIDYLLGLTDDKRLTRTDTPSTFIVRANELAAKNNVSKYRISKECGFDKGNFSKWASRGMLPQTQSLIAIAEYFDCSVEYLFGLSDSL
jgi:transcriptional regulator with XRE-family HTH domain